MFQLVGGVSVREWGVSSVSGMHVGVAWLPGVLGVSGTLWREGVTCGQHW